jgi:hypothetical protein
MNAGLRRAAGWIAVASAAAASLSLAIFRQPAGELCGDGDMALAGATLGFVFGVPAAGLIWVAARAALDETTARSLRWAGMAVAALGGLALLLGGGLGADCLAGEREDFTVAAVSWLVPLTMAAAGVLACLRATSALKATP